MSHPYPCMFITCVLILVEIMGVGISLEEPTASASTAAWSGTLELGAELKYIYYQRMSKKAYLITVST